MVVIASGTRNEPDPMLSGPDLAILSRAATGNSVRFAYVVNQNTGQPTRVPLTPLRPDGEVDHGPDRSQRLAANLRQVQALVRRAAADVPFDLLSFIAEAVRVTPRPGTLIVVSSGLSTAGAFSLQQVGWGADPAKMADQLKRAGQLPDLAGWHVVFSNLGTTARPQPPLPLPQRTELTSYWLAICHAAAAAECSVDTVTRPDPPTRSRRPVPVVPVPTARLFTGPGAATDVNIPDDTFFAFDSATLLPGADTVLGPLAAKAIAAHLEVSIKGFASPDGGTAAFNDLLSQRRAQSCEYRLIALGVPPGQIVSVTGEGTAGTPTAACYRDGQLDETICAQYRRVVISLTPAPTTTS
jgi:outer membrane protein OmpA-like peptidoglycan-associated protein